jgi:hypothetical protein
MLIPRYSAMSCTSYENTFARGMQEREQADNLRSYGGTQTLRWNAKVLRDFLDLRKDRTLPNESMSRTQTFKDYLPRNGPGLVKLQLRGAKRGFGEAACRAGAGASQRCGTAAQRLRNTRSGFPAQRGGGCTEGGTGFFRRLPIRAATSHALHFGPSTKDP